MTPCCLCGRPITVARWQVNYDCEQAAPVAPDVTTGGSGLLPIGPECVRRVPAAWRVRVEGNNGPRADAQGR